MPWMNPGAKRQLGHTVLAGPTTVWSLVIFSLKSRGHSIAPQEPMCTGLRVMRTKLSPLAKGQSQNALECLHSEGPSKYSCSDPDEELRA